VRLARSLPVLLAVALVAASGCTTGPAVGGTAPLQFTVGTTTFELVSGGVFRTNGQLRVHLTDAIDSCLAVVQVPVMTTNYLSFTVQPPTAGALTATVVTTASGPAAGEAIGTLAQRTGGVLTGTSYTAASGALTWSGGATGDLTLESIDVGFEGASGRVVAAGLLLKACN